MSADSKGFGLSGGPWHEAPSLVSKLVEAMELPLQDQGSLKAIGPFLEIPNGWYKAPRILM